MARKTSEIRFAIKEVDYKSFAKVVSTIRRETDEFPEHLQKKYHKDEEEPYVLVQTIWQRMILIGYESGNPNKTRILSPRSHDGQYFCINTGVQDTEMYDIFLLLGTERPYRSIKWFTCRDMDIWKQFDYMPSRCLAQRRKNSINFYRNHDANEPIRFVCLTAVLKNKIDTLCKRYCPWHMNSQLFFKQRIRESFIRTRQSVNAFIAVDDGMSFGWLFPVSLDPNRPDIIHCFVMARLNKSGRCYATKVFLPDEGYCFANISSVKTSRQEPVLRNMVWGA